MQSRWILPAVLFLGSCVGTTGGDVIDFQAAASGPEEAVSGQPLSFDTTRGWHVSLDTALLHIGALYLVDTAPVSGAQATSCILPGSYVAQVLQGRDVDLLSSVPQVFPVLGRGTTLEALAGQVWLTGGDVSEANDPPRPTVVLRLAGSAQRGADLRPFTAELTIAQNRIIADSGAAGADTICKQRIVTRPLSLNLERGGALWLRVDPRRLFTNVDFEALPEGQAGFAFSDDSSDQPSANLYNNLTQGGDLYTFSWVRSLR